MADMLVTHDNSNYEHDLVNKMKLIRNHSIFTKEFMEKNEVIDMDVLE